MTATASVTKKVRMTRDRAERLAALARAMGTTESDVIRQGIDRLDAERRREAAIRALEEMVEGETYEKLEMRMFDDKA